MKEVDQEVRNIWDSEAIKQKLNALLSICV